MQVLTPNCITVDLPKETSINNVYHENLIAIIRAVPEGRAMEQRKQRECPILVVITVILLFKWGVRHPSEKYKTRRGSTLFSPLLRHAQFVSISERGVTPKHFRYDVASLGWSFQSVSLAHIRSGNLVLEI